MSTIERCQPRWTRRDVLKLGAGLTGGGLVLGAGRPSSAQAAKVLRIAVSETRDPLDPAVYYGTSDMIIPFNTQETLVRYKMGTYEIEPLLADSWEVKDGGKAVAFKIRDGVKYIDGTKFNAESVKFEIERAIKINQGPGWMLTDFIDQVVVDGEQRLTLNLKRKVPGYLHYLAGAWAIRFQSPAAYKANEKDGDLGKAWAVTNTAGTAPYRIESYEKESRVVLVKNDGYWGGWKGNHIERVIINVIKEPATLRLQLEAGDRDVVFVPLKPADYAALGKNPNVVLGQYPSGTHYLMTLKCNQPPTDNKLVRQALSYAFNYDQVIGKIYGGNGQRIGPLSLGLEGDSPSLHTHYRFNLEKAKELLAQAGYPKGGLKLKGISRPVDPNLRLVFELFQSDLKKLNVDLEVVELAGAPWREQWRDPKADWNMLAHYWTPDSIEAGGAVFPLYKCEGYLEPGASNWTRLCNKKADELFQKTIEEADAKKRIANMQQVAQILLDEAPVVWMFWIKDVWPYRKTIKNFRYNGYYTTWATRIYDLSKEA
jgi:peptide/nickel transport system substrate-binding protein